jgi:hypothetical protein
VKFESGQFSGQAAQWADLIDSDPSEKVLSDYVLGVLGHYFKVDQEVTGYHESGRKFRIDAIVSGSDPLGSFAFGLEFKSPREAKETDHIMRQCAQYIGTSWRGFGRLPVFACPDPFDVLIHSPRAWTKNLCSAAYRSTDRYWIGGLRFCPVNGAMMVLPSGLVWSEAQDLTLLGRQTSNVRRMAPSSNEPPKPPKPPKPSPRMPEIKPAKGDGSFPSLADYFYHSLVDHILSLPSDTKYDIFTGCNRTYVYKESRRAVGIPKWMFDHAVRALGIDPRYVSLMISDCIDKGYISPATARPKNRNGFIQSRVGRGKSAPRSYLLFFNIKKPPLDEIAA